MNLEHAQQIVNHLQNQGIEAEIYEGYSGRGMFGTTTTGVVAPDDTDVIVAATELGIKADIIFRKDNLGRQMIVY